jgi:hypothetical protein
MATHLCRYCEEEIHIDREAIEEQIGVSDFRTIGLHCEVTCSCKTITRDYYADDCRPSDADLIADHQEAALENYADRSDHAYEQARGDMPTLVPGAPTLEVTP